jgi:putative methyltransferase (TIGR04325 family)
MTLRALARDLAPPALVRFARRSRGDRLRWAGQPANWKDALAASSGYSASNILAQVLRATEQVARGEACFERDGVVFNRPDHAYPLLFALLDEAVRNDGELEVLDFGGSLGSTYRQCRPMLDSLRRLRWCVVEQPQFVDAGRASFSTEELSFAGSLPSQHSHVRPHVLLASSVLQYLADPHAVLDQLPATGASTLFIDRTPVSDLPHDRLCIQHVPASIYPASYPCWILSRSLLMARLEKNWSLRAEFPCAEGSVRTDDGVPFTFVGLTLRRKTT